MSRRPDPDDTFQKIRHTVSDLHATSLNKGKLKRRWRHGTGGKRRRGAR